MKNKSLKNRICKYLALGFVCASCVGAFAYQAYAYYMSPSTRQVICEKKDTLPTSNYLCAGGQKVLVGSRNISEAEGTGVTLDVLLSAGSSIKEGTLSISTENDLLNGSILNSDLTAVNLSDKISLSAGESRIYKLQLSLNSEAVSKLSEDADAVVKLVWTSATDSNKKLEADFTVSLVSSTVATEVQEEAQETEEAEEPVTDMLTVANNALKTNPLLLSVTFPDGAEQIEIGTSFFNESGHFPPLTRYTTDGGESYTLLYESSKLYLKAADFNGSALVQLDFSACDIEWKDAVYEIYSSSLANGSWFETETDSMAMGSADTEVFAVTTNTSPAKVTENENLVWNISSATSKVEYSLEILTKDGYKAISDEGIAVTPALSNGQGTITVSSDGGKAQAGTYRLTITQLHDGIATGSKTVYFFVNYR